MSVFDGLPDIFTEALGVSVVYTPQGGSPVTIDAISVERSIEVQLADGPAVDDRRHVLHVRAADIAEPREGDQVTIDGDTFKVVPPIRPDGKGMIAITLSE